jgi:putative protein-disulfide isomerase
MAGTIGLDPAAFSQALDEEQDREVQSHIAATRRLMDSVGARGFPSFALERDGRITFVDATAWLGRPSQLQE